MQEMPHTALIGTGLMGAPMGRNLLRSGIPLTVWNRSRAKALPLKEDGAILAPSPADAVSEAQIVISMLTDGAATQHILDMPDLRAALRPGTIWIEMASIRPDQARAQAALLKELRVDHLDAPVSGGTKGADQGTLAIMVGGEAKVFDRALPALIGIGRPVLVGPSGAGQLAKLVNQAIVGVTIGVVAEAMLMLEKGGTDPAAVRMALKSGFADSTILQQHGRRMTERDFTPGGTCENQLKDLQNVLSEAAGLGLTLPFTQSAHDSFTRLIATLDGAHMDHSALFLDLCQQNGITV